MRVIALNKKHICPFLNEQKLCRLVCTFGDDVLSKTCRIFPREIHKFLDQEEFFLMPSCPAVIDLMKKYPNCNYIETGAENIEKEKNPEFNKLNFLRNVRSIFSDWMRRKEFDPQENLKHIFFAALELWRIWQENSNEDFLFSDEFQCSD
ncbi:MAG: flagellin lysine-N-methylase [Lachnospiraceae bacterium]